MELEKEWLAVLERIATALEGLANTVASPREGFPSIRVSEYPKRTSEWERR